jgi:hypothetical protein
MLKANPTRPQRGPSWTLLPAAKLKFCSPPHWLAEVAVVMARLSPATLATDVPDLFALDFDVADSLAVYQRASR